MPNRGAMLRALAAATSGASASAWQGCSMTLLRRFIRYMNQHKHLIGSSNSALLVCGNNGRRPVRTALTTEQSVQPLWLGRWFFLGGGLHPLTKVHYLRDDMYGRCPQHSFSTLWPPAALPAQENVLFGVFEYVRVNEGHVHPCSSVVWLGASARGRCAS